MRIRVGAAAVICVAMAWPGVAQAAPPVGGAIYVADAPGAERPSYLRVSADGRRLTDYLFAIRAQCSDGRSRQFGLNDYREKRFGLTPDGRFDHSSVGRRFTIRERGRRPITGRGSSRIVGSFSGDQAAIRFTNTFAGAVTCNATIPLTFNRIGSAGAPAADGLMTTGRYVFDRRGSGSQIRVSTVRALGPARIVEGLRVYWSVPRCASGRRRYQDAVRYLPLYLNRRGALSLTEPHNYNEGGGRRVRGRVTLKLRFRRQGATYVLGGSWRGAVRIYRRGKRIDTCRFSQRFRSVARP